MKKPSNSSFSLARFRFDPSLNQRFKNEEIRRASCQRCFIEKIIYRCNQVVIGLTGSDCINGKQKDEAAAST